MNPRLLFVAAFFSAIAAAPAFGLEADLSLLWQNELRSIADSTANPGNLVFQLPSRLHQAEFRAELHQGLGPLELTARPRLRAELARVNSQGSTGADIFFQEAFLKLNAHENFSLSIGRIQFGWGPAESVTPTNWLAPEIQLEPSPYFQQLGYTRAQANITLGKAFSLVLASELSPLPDHYGTREIPPEVFAGEIWRRQNGIGITPIKSWAWLAGKNGARRVSFGARARTVA